MYFEDLESYNQAITAEKARFAINITLTDGSVVESGAMPVSVYASAAEDIATSAMARSIVSIWERGTRRSVLRMIPYEKIIKIEFVFASESTSTESRGPG